MQCSPLMRLVVVVSLLSASTRAGADTATYSQPALDRWMYTWNSTPGTRSQASTFSALPGDSGEDDRLGQFLIGFNTADQVPAGLPVARYVLASVRLTTTIGLGDLFTHDPSPDPWQSYATPAGPPAIPDVDPGRPVELFGAGFRNGWTAATFLENSPYGALPGGAGKRNAHALGLDPTGVPRDVSSNVTRGFDPLPWAIGQAPLPAGQIVPSGTIYTFDVDLTLPGVDSWLRHGLAEGRLRFALSSLHPSIQEGGEFVSWSTKEDQNHLLFGGYAPTLIIRYDIPSLSITRTANGGILLTWGQTSGLAYQIQASDTPAFTTLENLHTRTATSDMVASHEFPAHASRKFYRLAVWRP